MTGDIIVYGDPHGEWAPLLNTCAADPPVCVILLGDCGLTSPLRKTICKVFEAGIGVRWIPGNHDTDTIDDFDRLWSDYPEGNLHGRSEMIGGMRVAGLGGIFKKRVWYPRFDRGNPLHDTRKGYMAHLQRSDHWRGGLPLRLRDAVFPEDVRGFGEARVDILVTHEAPSAHRHGFLGIDVAAHLCRARLIVHGHHHDSYEGLLPDGARVRGLGKAEVLRIKPGDT
jgi:predicted phosphodiesterase